MPLLSRVRVLAAKIETTAGTVETLTGTEGAFNCYDVSIQPGIEFNKRSSQGSFGNIKGNLGMRSGTVTFKTDLVGDGAGGVPAWASTFLPACGWVNSAGTFSPIAQPPGSSVKTITIGVYENGVRKLLRGCAGTFKLMLPVGKPAQFDWTFTGVWQAVADISILAPTYPTRQSIRAAAGTISIGSWAPCFSNMEIDAGNVITPRECISAADGSGLHSYMIGNREVTGTMDPESNLVATSNADVYGDWLAGEEDSFSIVLADAADEITLAGPKMQRTNVQEGDRGGLQTDSVNFQFNKSSGNDEFTIAFGVA